MSTANVISRRLFLNILRSICGATLASFTAVTNGRDTYTCGTFAAPASGTGTMTPSSIGEGLSLPPPCQDGQLSLEQSLSTRRSVRAFSEDPLSWEAISQLLWAAQGITDPTDKRTAPSAGALYPLELYVATGEGFYHYQPSRHVVLVRSQDDLRPALHEAALQQEAVLHAPAVFVVTAVYARTEAKYGHQRSPRYVHLEAGHAAQNVLLQAVALGLGSVPIGAFYDEKVSEMLDLPDDHEPLYLIPVGHLRT